MIMIIRNNYKSSDLNISCCTVHINSMYVHMYVFIILILHIFNVFPLCLPLAFLPFCLCLRLYLDCFLFLVHLNWSKQMAALWSSDLLEVSSRWGYLPCHSHLMLALEESSGFSSILQSALRFDLVLCQ